MSDRYDEDDGGHVQQARGIATSDIPWRYINPPYGVKLNLLTKGCVAVTGKWSDDGRYIAWQYLFCRDKELEEKLGIKVY